MCFQIVRQSDFVLSSHAALSTLDRVRTTWSGSGVDFVSMCLHRVSVSITLFKPCLTRMIQHRLPKEIFRNSAVICLLGLTKSIRNSRPLTSSSGRYLNTSNGQATICALTWMSSSRISMSDSLPPISWHESRNDVCNRSKHVCSCQEHCDTSACRIGHSITRGC